VVIDFVPYDFRHTFATRIAENGVDLPTLAALLGHDGIRCVQKYVHPTAGHKKEAMKIFDRAIQTRKRQEMGAPAPFRPEVGHDTPSLAQ